VTVLRGGTEGRRGPALPGQGRLARRPRTRRRDGRHARAAHRTSRTL